MKTYRVWPKPAEEEGWYHQVQSESFEDAAFDYFDQNDEFDSVFTPHDDRLTVECYVEEISSGEVKVCEAAITLDISLRDEKIRPEDRYDYVE